MYGIVLYTSDILLYHKVKSMDTYPNNVRSYATEAGILAGVESFVRGLPDSVRHSLSGGELADIILNMIEDLRKKNYGELVQ